MNFLGPFIEVGECIVNGKFNTQYATVLMDFGLHFIARVIALQFCRSLEEIFSHSRSLREDYGKAFCILRPFLASYYWS